MTTKNVTPRPQRGKAAAHRAADTLTAERVRAILSDTNTGERVTLRLTSLVNRLGEATDAPAPETPDFYAHAFAYGAGKLRRGAVARLEEKEAREAAEQIARLAERHEPQAYKVARRCREIYADWLGRRKGRKYADGASYFVEHVDAVLEGGEDGLVPNPDSKYFTPLFVEAWNERDGRRDYRVRALLDLIKRVDEGADLNQFRDDAHREHAEREEAHRPKDARIVDALSKVIADSKREDDRIAILDAINNLSNHTYGVYDFHPEIFPTLARVILREARQSKAAKGRGFVARSIREDIRRLEEIANE